MTTLLIIENNPKQMKHLSTMAMEINSALTIISAETGNQALEILSLKHIDVIFITIELPDISGIELIRHLRQKKHYYFTPIVFMSYTSQYEQIAFKELKAYGYLIKPYSKKTLNQLTTKLLESYPLQDTQVHSPIILTYKGQTYTLPPDSIILIEYHNRKIRLTTINEEIRYKHMTLSNFQHLLPDHFIRVHQSFVINLHFIKKVDHHMGTLNCYFLSHIVPIGKNYRTLLKNYYK